MHFFQCENLKSIEIPQNSELLSIGEFAFSFTIVKKLSIPSKFKEFQEGWCSYFYSLNKVEISSDNKNFEYADDGHKLIVGKSESNSDCFDVLIFACRNINKALIPSKIKYISSFAFFGCNFLDEIEFEKNSNLLSIGKNSFNSSSIKKITFPSKLEDLIKGWCSKSLQLNNITILPDNRNFKYIDNEHKMIAGKSDQNSGCFDVLVFACRDIEKAVIPSTIKYISDFAFQNCKLLKTVDFEDNSELLIIGKKAFCDSSIETIFIPEKLNKIKKGAFSQCKKLEIVEFSCESSLKSIGKTAFSDTIIKKIRIPKETRKISSFAFSWSQSLEKIEIPKNAELISICECAFAGTLIKSLFISPNVEDLQMD